MTDRPAQPDWVRFVAGRAAGPAPALTRRVACALALACGLGSFGLPAASAAWQGPPARQVVVFGVMARPGSNQMDPKIAPVVQAQLRKLLPNHGFEIIKIKGDRVAANKAVKCELGPNSAATAKLLKPTDNNGKVQMHLELTIDGMSQFQTIVSTPPDQFNFFDKAMPNGNRLLVGVGAR